jgi:serine/threonine protein phosphatase PrpC
VALKIGQGLHVLSVGDSLVFLIRGGEIVPFTFTPKGQTFLGVMNALGRHEKLAYKSTWISLQDRDRLLLVTDGIIENMAPSELAALVAHARSPEEAAIALQQLLAEKQLANRGRIDDPSGFRRDDATAIVRYFVPDS